jgi:hypothetical protein
MYKYGEGKNKFRDMHELAIDYKDNAYKDDEDHENTYKFTKKEKFFQSCSQSRNEKVHLKKADIILLLDSKDNSYLKYTQKQTIQVFSIADIKLKV